MTTLAAAPSESSLFDTIGDLPLHPLIVHVAVVILPLAALGLLVLLFVPRWRGTFGWLTMAGLFVGLVGAFAAKESGEALANRIGLPPDHARLGDILPFFAFGLSVVGLVWFLLDRRARARQVRSTAAMVLGVIAGLAAVATIVMTVLVGHSGATATWAWKIAPAASPAAPSQSATPSPAATGAQTMADVQAHSSTSDCWAAINGNVYDLTAWIGQHPGGPRDIERICGTDGSADFNGQHEGQREPEQDLARFLIGPLDGSASAAGPMTVTNAAFATSKTVAAIAPAIVATAKKYTRAQVRKHRTATDCWTVINRKVYDLTAWVRQHPGGASRILAICGKDGTSAFTGQHAGDTRPAAELKRFQIGVLR